MPKPYTPNDKWSQRAREESYRARSIYKLKELDERFGLLKPGMTVLDLGAAPGSWLQYAKERVGPKGKVIGVDLQPIEPIEGVQTIQADITHIENITRILSELHTYKTNEAKASEANEANKLVADLILSDLAPSTSGMKDVDQWRSIELNQAVLEIAKRFLKLDGHCILKILRGADFDEFLRKAKNEWKSVKTAQVKASRDRSKEIYLVMS